MALFYNQAKLSFGDTSVTSNIVTGEIIEVLSASKNALEEDYLPGQTLTYAVSLTNTGESSYDGLIVTDDLGAYTAGGMDLVPLEYVEDSLMYYEDGVLQPAPVVSATSPLTVSGICVPANGNAMLIYQATVNEYAPIGAGEGITNTVTISGARLSESVAATSEVESCLEPVLSVIKALDPVAVPENGTVNYTITMENRGCTAASDGVVLTDTFDPILNGITVTCDGKTWQSGVEYNYDQSTGAFTTLPGAITIPAASASQSLTDGSWSVTPGDCTVVISGTI